ncbi:acyl transferase domain-containing protein [Xylaria cf. heliscus]|nr:acyl transferase domain-containing protein [Xylaria cf. heliscus]
MGRSPEKSNARARLSFVFTGQGAQWYAMGRELLYTHSSFAASLQKPEGLLKSLGASWSLYEELNRDQDTSRINESEISQPVTTALQIALVDLFESLSIRPNSVVGHSSGEIAAAYTAGALSHESALRVSFHRSKVSRLARQIIGIPGGMLVTSLGESQAYDYINRVTKGRLSLACVNSPGSTTISGDREAIDELRTVLVENSIINKTLAVDVAYHSHHMKVIEGQYLNLLSGLETAEALKDVQFFSSVTAELKTSNFGAEYWAQNLVSTVRISDALIQCYNDVSSATGSRAAARIFLEIGPHSALGGPLKHTLASLPNKADYEYTSAIIRGKDVFATVATASGKLSEFGLNVDVEAVNAIQDGTKVGDMVVDLPPYAWEYSNRFWHESRLIKEYRFRKYPYHDLLGLWPIGSTPLEPIWRNILTIDAQPWLNEHIVDGFAILPVSSFLTMAMEAARQLSRERGAPNTKRFHLKKVGYSKAIMIPESPGKVEVMISLSTPGSGGATSRSLSEWESFKITSSHNADTLAMNCCGHIKLEYDYAPNEIDAGREEETSLLDMQNRLSQADAACTQSIDHDSPYEEMRRNGIDYGTNFATLQELRIGGRQALGRVVIPDVAQCMPSGYQQPHIIHPATFDAPMHIVLPLYFRNCTPGTAMLRAIEEVSVAADMVSTPGGQLTVCATLSPSGQLSGSVDFVAFQKV